MSTMVYRLNLFQQEEPSVLRTFDSSDMKEEGGKQRVILKSFAVPTIFPTSQVMKYGEACNKEGSSHENFHGTSDKKSSSVETVVINEDSVSVNEEIIATDSESFQDVTIEDNVNIPGGKRKYLDETEIEVSMSKKRAQTTSSSEKNAHYVKSPRRVRSQVDDLIDKVENLQKRLKTSQKKTNRREKKVSTLTTVVSELREKNLINSDCVTILESTFSRVPKELMKRLVTKEKSWGVST
ncbi:Hypothetical predicted protein [Paramuricea clavata]|uniref:Uncharacterized protein n=1 Tax=Paramuricea clavata TaxID=317549 RepID=A0A6S7L614_PARCT|nr:Hypothetical predicted protein [Paramuricea clavata]